MCGLFFVCLGFRLFVCLIYIYIYFTAIVFKGCVCVYGNFGFGGWGWAEEGRKSAGSAFWYSEFIFCGEVFIF